MVGMLGEAERSGSITSVRKDTENREFQSMSDLEFPVSVKTDPIE